MAAFVENTTFNQFDWKFTLNLMKKLEDKANNCKLI